jgi:hypothetical protein
VSVDRENYIFEKKSTQYWMRVAHMYPTNHLQHNNNNKNTISEQTLFSFFSNGFPAICGADTLHLVGSYHDRTTCKVSAETIRWLLTFLSSCAPPAAWEGTKGSTPFSFFPNDFLAVVRGADTLHVVGSYHDPTICKVLLPNRRF